MPKLNELKKHLRRGRVYRRADLEPYSKAVDRHLKQLVEAGTLKKVSRGLYYYPKQTVFGQAPPDDETLVRAFLKNDHFLLTSPNAYNALGVGTTQLYNKTVVYNHKRHGEISLGGRFFDFQMKPYVPNKISHEFLLVDLVNNLNRLAENTEKVLNRVRVKARSMPRGRLSKAVLLYGKVSTKKFFHCALANHA